MVLVVQQVSSSPIPPSDPTSSDEPEPKSTGTEPIEIEIKCSALCGNKATGKLHVKVKHKAMGAEETTITTVLPLCDSCRERIDPHHEWVFVRFT